jgi:hypothetical protein
MLLVTSSISLGLDVVRLKTTSLSLTIGKTRFFSYQVDTTGSLYALLARCREEDLCERDINLAKSSENLGTSISDAQEWAPSPADQLSLYQPLPTLPRYLSEGSLNPLIYI